LPSPAKKGTTVEVKVAYSTTPESTALQWLEKECVRLSAHRPRDRFPQHESQANAREAVSLSL
jgi:hypothetical protein